jgi:hypothetical protein
MAVCINCDAEFETEPAVPNSICDDCLYDDDDLDDEEDEDFEDEDEDF